MIKKDNNDNPAGRILAVLLITVMCLVTWPARVCARPALTNPDRGNIGLSMMRDDGIRVLIRENGVYYCNTGITFFIEGQGALCEYCLCPEGGDGSVYKVIDDGILRLAEKDYARKEGSWSISFRAMDEADPESLIWRAGPYRIRFDVTAPMAELSFEKSSLIPDTVTAGISMKDENSGISYAELRQDGEILYRQDFPAKEGSGLKQSVKLFRRSGQIKGSGLKLFVMDRAGNGKVLESRYYGVLDKAGGRELPALREQFRLPLSDLPMPGERSILAGYVAVSLTLIGLLGEVLYRILNRIWFGKILS